ncbi:hypothetical protein [Halarcobacter bivalviorum]|uniref:Membrane protein n=1 Tax=Halarcobacter bivalviorum TaxID=663364 RepID=A0AAX2AEW9_9BACT|nr:hypothetical protein [Halarcobacter bivalviorum]AXH12165.1 putative membrane protein [Halarcobacter bivalviorum]RXK11271.1 hypothetical protein CRV05_02575 [Halarcobacter bivalviorum]
MKYFILLFFSGILLDIVLKKYKYSNKLLNYFLVFIMVFGHPLYFGLSLIIAIIINGTLSQDPLFNHFTFAGYIVLILSAIVFAFFRFIVYYKYFIKKDFRNYTCNDLYRYSRFYIFTLFGIALYLSTVGTELEFYTVYMLQLFLPFLVIFVLMYSLIKVSIIKDKYQSNTNYFEQRKKNLLNKKK